MKFLFVKSNAIGSKIIRWGLNSSSSHFAICFDEDLGENSAIVFHSYGSRGTHLLWLSEFMEKYEVVTALDTKKDLVLHDQEKIYRAILSAGRSKGYDFKGLLWWFVRGAMFLAFRIPIPQKNAWQQDGYFLCTKLAEEPMKAAGCNTSEIDFEAISLDGLRDLMISSGHFMDSTSWTQAVNLSRA